MRLYRNKQQKYFTQVREDLIAQMPKTTTGRVLEIGAGGCDTLVTIKERGLAKEVYAVELFEMPDTNQQNSLVDRLFITDIETSFPKLDTESFDIILCGDVLEHLVDPWQIVKKLSRLLKPEGLIIASCPNIREISTILGILATGRFRYQESGILDKTHLRFFGLKDLVDLLTLPDLKPIIAKPNYFISPRRGNFSKLHFGLLDDFLSPQVIVVSKKINP